MEANKNQQVPTHSELMEALQKRLNVSTLQLGIQENNTKIASLIAQEKAAYAEAAKYGQPQGDVVQHTVTKEDLDNNSELGKQGITEGQVIGIPKESYDEFKKSISPLQDKEDSPKMKVAYKKDDQGN